MGRGERERERRGEEGGGLGQVERKVKERLLRTHNNNN